MKILFYGRLADAIGPELQLDGQSPCSVAELRDRLAEEHPHAQAVLQNRRALTCVGDRFVRDDHSLSAGDIVEFMPPVSGG